jgi:hypothetical protein
MDTKIHPVISARKRGPYRQHSTEFKRAVVAKSLVEGTEIDNSAAEHALRGVAIDRRNDLFASAGSGGERAAGALACTRRAGLMASGASALIVVNRENLPSFSQLDCYFR